MCQFTGITKEMGLKNPQKCEETASFTANVEVCSKYSGPYGQ